MFGYTHQGNKRAVILTIMIVISLLFIFQPAHAEVERKPVILVFYGGWKSHFDIVYPELEKYGFSAVFIPTTENIGIGYDEKGKALLMNWDMIIELQKNGHEIGSGGWAFSEELSELGYPDVIREIYYSKDRLENHGINIYGFSKNYNITDKKYIDMIKGQYAYLISSVLEDESVVIEKEDDLYELKGTEVGQMLLSEFYGHLTKIGDNNTIMFIYERIGDTGGREIVPTRRFKEQMRYLDSMGYKGVSVKEYFDISETKYSSFDTIDDVLRIVIISLLMILVIIIFHKSGK